MTLETTSDILPAEIEKLAFLRRVEKFLIHELSLLDDRRFEEWLDLFTDDGTYWAPAEPDQRDPENRVSLFFDDKTMMRTRISRLRHPRIHSQIPHSRTSHMIGNLTVDPEIPGAESYRVCARFVILEYRPEKEQRTFGGRYDYELVPANGTFLIRRKKASLVNCDAVMAPLALPF